MSQQLRISRKTWCNKSFNVRLGDKTFHIHPPVSIPVNIAPTPKPNKDDLVRQHASRFPKQHAGDQDVGV